MSLERLYYHDPFSNIILSCNLNGSLCEAALVDSIKKTVQSIEIFGCSIFDHEDGRLLYRKVGYKRNLDNVLSVNEDDQRIIKTLAAYAFDLQQGESLRILYKPIPTGFTLYLCMHHIVGDAQSGILLLQRILAAMGGKETAIKEILPGTKAPTGQLDFQSQYLLNTINKEYRGKPSAEPPSLQMQEAIHAKMGLKIRKLVVEGAAFAELRSQCKKLGGSLTAYLALELLEKGNADRICLPLDTRDDKMLFGNYVGRIDIHRKLVESKMSGEEKLRSIHSHIQASMKDVATQRKSELLLEAMPPRFFDDVIYDLYYGKPNPFARKMAKLIGFKDPKPTTFVSNLKIVDLDCKGVDVTASDLSFYPPHPKERTSTIGVVTLNNQMVLTIQQSG